MSSASLGSYGFVCATLLHILVIVRHAMTVCCGLEAVVHAFGRPFCRSMSAMRTKRTLQFLQTDNSTNCLHVLLECLLL